MTTLKAEATARMRAPTPDLTEEQVYHLLNCPAYQTGGKNSGIEKEIGQRLKGE